MITTDSQVGRIATEHPMATRVFARYGIDYCCGGGVALGEACRSLGIDPSAIVDEIERELESRPAPAERWDEASLHDLVTHILVAYHRPLHEELPRLEAMARKVLEVHREKDPERLPALVSVFVGLKAELEAHMAKEEQILFPMIERGQGGMAEGPISVMESEHEDAGAALRKLRELTNDYEVPPHACNTWRALWHGLAALETALHEHIHLENNILFPRSLAS